MTKARAPQIVGVISSRADLGCALRLRNPPDFFELRLDALRFLWRAQPPELAAPLVITARHPREGGVNELSLRQRRDLLFQFLPRAAYLDIEVRSAQAMAPLLARARGNKVGTILSVHDFTATPGAARLRAWAAAAHSLGADIFKVATRTDTDEELRRLLDLLEAGKPKMKVAVMGLGRLGRKSRIESARRGSALSYVHLGTAQVSGQLSLAEMRRALRQF